MRLFCDYEQTGTYAGYKRHGRENVPSCLACRRANTRYMQKLTSTPEGKAANVRNATKSQKKHPEKRRAASARRAAKVRGAEGSFDDKDQAVLIEVCDNRCVYCGISAAETKLGKLTLDHRVPLSKGGRNDIENILLACMPCNVSKGAKDLRVWLLSRAINKLDFVTQEAS